MSHTSDSEALLLEFVEQAIIQSSATRAADANRAAQELASIYRRIRDLGPEAVARFVGLTNHANESVRLWAATYGLEIASEACEPVLEALSEGPPGPVRLSASMSLREWRGGRLRFP